MKLGPFSAKEHLEITTLGMEFALAEIAGAGVGYWLDKKFYTTPWLLLAGVACGFIVGFYRIWQESKRK